MDPIGDCSFPHWMMALTGAGCWDKAETMLEAKCRRWTELGYNPTVSPQLCATHLRGGSGQCTG
jgi:hypothetical protein